MKTTLFHVRRLAMAAALLGVVFSPRATFAQSMLDASEAQAFLGEWSVSLDTEYGVFAMDLTIEDQGGKVAATVGSPDMGTTADVTDITRSDESLVLSYEMDAEGQLFSVSVTLALDGEDLKASFDFGGQLYADGIAKRSGG